MQPSQRGLKQYTAAGKVSTRLCGRFPTVLARVASVEQQAAATHFRYLLLSPFSRMREANMLLASFKPLTAEHAKLTKILHILRSRQNTAPT